jgi:GT2 family glycosyltransferase/glycosyltransferase involved in cell wall biosynthesis
LPAEVLAERIREESAKRQAAERKVEGLRWTVVEETAARVAAQHEADALRSAIADETAARAALQHQAQMVFSSTSWRLTRPLRAAVTAIKKFADVLIPRKSASHTRQTDKGSPEFSLVFDSDWYLGSYPDAATSGMAPLQHYQTVGVAAGYEPCQLFDSAWYVEQNPDITESGLSAVEHYLRTGAAQLRDPHWSFNAAFYVFEHPEAAPNPLAHYMRIGRSRHWPTQPPFKLADYLPSAEFPSNAPRGVEVDIIIPVFRGFEETRRCIESVVADPERPPGRIVVVDDCSPERSLSEWLGSAADDGSIKLVRNDRNLGFVASVNRGIAEAGRRDVVLLNSDTEVPRGWLARLIAHAYGAPKIGTVTPFSNNATICSYPAPSGGTLSGSRFPAAIDAACRAANAGRSVAIPTGIGFCMYIRRDCLDAVGCFDEQTFGRGYGEENDFCMRAAALGWKHLLACDTFVYHAGGVSFGADSPERARAAQELRERHPDYESTVARFVRRDPAKPYRFAVTAALFHAAAEPTILMFSHCLGGGTGRHVSELVAEIGQRANLLLLRPCIDGSELSIPSLPGHPVLRLADDHSLDDLITLLNSFNIRRVHVHHLIGFSFDLRELIERLQVPFDVTVHDFFSICPQVHLLRALSDKYCGEPGEAGCNNCIALQPSHGARDITAWRHQYAWLLRDADRVICPSEDVRRRLARYVRRPDLILAPHEPITSAEWPISPLPLRLDERIRIGLLGTIASHKGRDTLLKSAAAADPAEVEFVVIGRCNPPIPPVLHGMISETGTYREEELSGRITLAAPHLLWFPVPCPESYSYVLSAAIASARPIIATRLGAFPERLAGRPWTWLVDPDATVTEWLDAFAAARDALLNGTSPVQGRPRPTTETFYPDAYLRPAADQAGSRGVRRCSFGDRTARLTVALLPECSPDGGITPSGYVRLLLPLDHLAQTHREGVDVTLVDERSAGRRVANVLVCQRQAARDIPAAERMIEHCRATGMLLAYDLDEDLPDTVEANSDLAGVGQSAAVVRRMLSAADIVWVPTRILQRRFAPLRPDTRLVRNRLDERLWGGMPNEPPWSAADRGGPVRILYRGAPGHDPNLALLKPVALRLQRDLGQEVSFEVMGVSVPNDLGPALRRVQPPASAVASYPAFVAWLTGQRRWHIGVAPLADSAPVGFIESNRLLEYAALGLAVLASDVAAHRDDALRGSVAMRLVANAEDAWFAALAELLQDARVRRHRGRLARDAVLKLDTLATQGEELYRALAAAAERTGPERRISSW